MILFAGATTGFQLDHNASLTVALGLVLGILGQAAARHLRIPGIVVLLALGVAVGPDVAGVVRPGSLGEGLQILIDFAVSIILFEGALCLNVRQLRREGSAIRRLVTWGAMVTAVGATLAARLILEWAWTPSILFGTLVIVTGPTVINPLLRRIRVQRKVATVLEAEGIFGDAIGAIVAVVALEVLVAPSRQSFALGASDLVVRFVVGGLVGAAGGLLMIALLRREGVVPEGLQNVFTLAQVLLVFQLSNAFVHESGIVAVIVAGLLLGNAKIERADELREFKEQLTVMFIGLLFVLLAADVRLADVEALGVRGLLVVAALIFVVRPLNVAVGTLGTPLSLRQKAFIAWMAPRGIVAAAVSSLFATRLVDAGIEGGSELRAMVFLTIAVTVTVAGLTGGLVARALGIRPHGPGGVLVLGANDLGLVLGEVCRRAGREVAFIDANPAACHAAEERDFQVLYGSGLDENLLVRATLASREAAIGLTTNDGVNFTFARRVKREHRLTRVFVALRKGQRAVTQEMVERMGGEVLFGGPRDIERWNLRLGRDQGRVCVFRFSKGATSTIEDVIDDEQSHRSMLAIALQRKSQLRWVDKSAKPRAADLLYAL
ncbi:MAG TPA: cation:proton antiporter, partial [Thermoanaerobaculia bacterium]|nr:cation:proton antiporter [Thermoanaerobaculia bacterium]